MAETVKQLSDAEQIAEHVTRMLTSRLQYPDFADSAVPVEVAARVMGKDATWIRQGIEDGWLAIGVMKPPENKGGRRNFYISPKLFWELTGYVWKGEKV